jgi:hypothetical protein
MAALLGARLAAALLPPAPLTPTQRARRAEAGRSWLGTAAVHPVPKAAVTRLLEATGAGDVAAVATALAKVTDVTAPWLDRPARSELEQLVRDLRS